MASKQIDLLAAGIVDSSGNVLQSGTVELYESGTSTPITGYSDAALGSSLGSTITLDSRGAKLVFVDGLVDVKLVIKDSAGTTVNTYDGLDYNASEANITETDPEFVMQNTDQEDTDGGRQSTMRYKGEQSGGEVSTLGTIVFSHDGTSDDQKGKLVISLNDGTDNDSPTSLFTLSSAGVLNLVGSMTLSGSTFSGYINQDVKTTASPEFAGLSVGESTPLGLVHFKSADSATSSVSTSGDELVLENSGDCGMTILGGTGNNGTIYFGNSGGSTKGFLGYNSSTDYMTLGTDASEAIRIISTGSVGIGETSPLGKLHVRSADSGVTAAHLDGDELVIEGSGNSGLSILSGNTSTSNIMFGDDGDNNIGQIQYTHSTTNSMGFHTAATLAMTIDSSQNMGIGETTPQGKLHVKSADAGAFTPDTNADEGIFENSGAAGIMIVAGPTSLCQVQMGDAAAPADCSLYYDNNTRDFAIQAAGAERMRIESSGDIGIGESGTPLGKLHVKTADSSATVSGNADEFVIEGSTTSGMTILSGTANSGNIHFGDSGDNDIGRITYDHSANNLLFTVNGGFAWTIDSNKDLLPNTDNSFTLGNASFRLNELFCTNATINTSDEREKTIQADNSAVLDVIDSISIKAFKWNDAIEEKGDAARIHYGIMAQDLKAAFEAANLDPSVYSVFCYDSWEESTGPDGETIPAGDRYGVRYEELYALKVACLDRRLSTLENA